MNIEIIPHALGGSIDAVASKSHGHRLLIAAALSQKTTKTIINTTSEDLEATRSCLAQLKSSTPVLNCRESGSTLRFLLPVAMALKGEAIFMGSGRLPNRPISPLKEEMEAHGCSFSNQHRKRDGTQEICHVKGNLKGGIFTLPGNVSSQYITGLLFALPLLKENSQIRITSPLESKGYVDLTLDVLRMCHVDVCAEEKEGLLTYNVQGRQQYLPPAEMTAEGDWSNIAFWVAAGVLSGESGVICRGLNLRSIQGDRKIINLARRMGGSVSEQPTGLSAMKAPLKGIPVDVSAIPDLVPILAVMAAGAKGTTRIHNAARLRLKESDRLSAMHDCLSRLGADVTEEPDGLTIVGGSRLTGGAVSGYNDHRIVMAMAIASVLCDAPLIIEGTEAVNKSYPGFFEDFERMGGEYRVL